MSTEQKKIAVDNSINELEKIVPDITKIQDKG